ncbi:MAG: SRPBCC domain-containing protein, partial [Nitrospirota bacterium]
MRTTTPVILFFTILAVCPGVVRAQENHRLVHEALVNAPLEQVWAAFTTKAGLESWMVAHAEIELKIGGRMKTQYDPKGTTD